MPAKFCGCDSEAHWQCEVHREQLAEKMNKILDSAKADGIRRSDEILSKTLFVDSEPPHFVTPEELLRQQHPYGHPRFLPITLKEIQLHSDKNYDYAKGGTPLGNFTRVAQILALYPNLKLSDQRVVALVYAMKQLDAVLWGMNSDITHKVEGANQRLQDISVYVKLVMAMNEDIGEQQK